MLHDVICIGELRAVSARGAQAATDAKSSTNEVYDLFFDSIPKNIPDKTNDALMRIAGQDTAGTMVGDVVGAMIVDNNGELQARLLHIEKSTYYFHRLYQ